MRRRIFRTPSGILSVIAFATCATMGASCAHRYHEGPAQHAGREVDHAVGKAGDAVEHAGHEVNRALPHDD